MEGANNPESIQYPEIAAEITVMRDADQAMRKRNLESEGAFWDETMDPKNTARMKEIVEQIGWPTISKVGNEASDNAWLLVQHADQDVEFQQYCLDLMKREPSAEVDMGNIAYLEDRVRVNTGRPQVYGTQFRWEGSKPIQNIEDPENVNQRRAEVGLDTLEENLKRMQEKYNMIIPEEGE